MALWVPYTFSALVAVHALSILWARSPALAINATMYWCSFLLLYLTFVLALRSRIAVSLLFACGAIAAVLTAGWVVFEDATHGRGFGDIVARLPDWRGHLSAGLGNSGHIAGYMGLFLPWLLWRFLASPSRTHRILLLCALVILAMAFIVTWSVGSSAATLVSLAIWTLVAWRARALDSISLRRCLWLIVPVAAACAFYLLPHPLNPHSPSLMKEAFGSQRWAEGWPTRVVIWKTTIHMIEHSFPLGIGAGSFTLEYVRQVVPSVVSEPALRVYAGAFTNDAHNEYLQIACETGIAGLLFFSTLIISFFAAAAHRIRTTTSTESKWLLICAGSGVTVFLLDSIMTFPIRLPAHFAAFTFFLAVPAVLAEPAGADLKNHRARAIRFRFGAPLLVLLVLACLGWQFRRVAAEYHLKLGRTTVENSPFVVQGRVIPLWSLGDSLMREALMHLAEGNREQMAANLRQAQHAMQGDAVTVAEQQFRKSLSSDPHYSNASSRLGALLLMKGQYVKSADITKTTLKDLESSEIHERLGFAEFLQQNWPAARQAWTTCKLRRPVQAPFYDALIRQIPPE